PNDEDGAVPLGRCAPGAGARRRCDQGASALWQFVRPVSVTLHTKTLRRMPKRKPSLRATTALSPTAPTPPYAQPPSEEAALAAMTRTKIAFFMMALS